MSPGPPRRDSEERYRRRESAAPASVPEVVDPRWLLRALGLVAGAAVVLGYGAVCLLVVLGGWQMILHPARTVDRTPAALGIAFDAVRFDAGPTGSPRLTAWWIPSGAPDRARATILLLHGGDGSLATALPLLAELHATGNDVFAFDPRGFGGSAGPHPSEERMQEDAEAALEYLRGTRGRELRTIVPYGNGLGAVLAAALVQAHPELPALIIDNPDPEVAKRLAQSGQMRLIPVHLLLGDRFELTPARLALPQPKLLISGGPGRFAQRESGADDHSADALALFRQTASPKLTVTLGPGDSANYRESVRRFLDEALPAPVVPVAPGTPAGPDTQPATSGSQTHP